MFSWKSEMFLCNFGWEMNECVRVSTLSRISLNVQKRLKISNVKNNWNF